MAKKTNAATTNKSQAIRDYQAANPDAKPADIAKALFAQGIEVNAGRVASVLSNRSSSRVDVESIKKAAAFIKASGDTERARRSLEMVGQFVKDLGSPKKALAAIDAVESLSAVAT